MFGYVRPFKGEMLVKEYDAYKGVYCALCRALGEHYGRLSRMALSYDCTFYALLAMNQKNAAVRAEKKCCTCNPLKKCVFVCPQNAESDAAECYKKAAALCVIMTVYKLRDTIEDERFGKRLGARFLCGITRGAMKKAAADYSEMAKAVAEMMEKQHAAELLFPPSVDACAAPTAELLETLCAQLGETDGERAVLGRVGYFLGRWVYLMDAADDLADDVQKRKFNPFISSMKLTGFLGEKLPTAQRDTADRRCNEMLNGSVSMLLPAMNLLPNGPFMPIIENVLSKGLPEMQREILFLHIKEKRNGRSV